MYIPDVIGDVEPHFLKIWEAEDFSNPFLVEPTPYGTKISLLVCVIFPYIIITKHPYVPLFQVCEKLFILHMVVRGSVVQVDPGGVQFFTLIGLLVHPHGYSVL